MEDVASYNDLSKPKLKLKSEWDIISHTNSDFETPAFNKKERDIFALNSIYYQKINL